MKKLALLLLAFVLAYSSPAYATISTPQSSIQIFGNGVSSIFGVPYTPDSAQNISVIYTNASGVATTLSPSQYTITIPPTPVGQLWASSFNLTYPLTGSPIASNTSLTISRIIPLFQTTALSNQGNFYPQAVEAALDTTLMQLQQVSARTGQQRGTWISGATYNYGDVVQDGVNGSDSGNYYMCAIADTSGVWTTDLANGDWSLVIQSTLPTTPLPLSVANGGTGASTPTAALNNLGGISLSGNNTFTGANTFTGGSIAVPTANPGDSSSKAASTNFVNGTALTLASGTTAVTQAAGTNNTTVATMAALTSAVVPTITPLTSGSGTYNTPTGALVLHVKMVGGGGGGGSSGTGNGSGGSNGGNTTFGTTLLSAGGGTEGSTSGVTGGAGGTSSLGSGPVGMAIPGGQGAVGSYTGAGITSGGAGGSSCFGGAGSGGGGTTTQVGSNGATNTGGGGGGGGGGGDFNGTGGGSGGCVEAWIISPTSTYSYAVGSGGTGETASSGGNGGIGGSGSVLVEAY